MFMDRLAQILVRHSTAVRPGDVVSLTGPPLSESLIVALYREVLQAGGYPLVVMQPEACTEVLYRHGSDQQLTFVNPLESREVEAVDVAIHVLATENPRALADVDPRRQANRGRARQGLMTRFLERSLRWVATVFPCPAAAQEAGLSLAKFTELVHRAGRLHRPDPAAAWRAIETRQALLIEALSQASELRLVTPKGTDLRLGIAGRAWINCAGQHNFPDGEVYTAPIEDATEGMVCFDFPARHSGRAVRGVRLRFRAGQVIDAAASAGEDFLIRMLDQDASARVLGEVALGCNYALTSPTGHPLLDEKIGGTFHLALGAAYPQTGGTNRSGLHWDLVGDLRRGGRVEADGRVIGVDGRFQDPGWPQEDN